MISVDTSLLFKVLNATDFSRKVMFHKFNSAGWGKKDVIPLVTYWAYVFLKLTYRNIPRLIVLNYVILCFTSTGGH